MPADRALDPVNHGEAERQFREFQRTGSLRAMARVFDLVAPEILILASHLARDRAGAEDLLQSTFLEAIEHAERFDARRPLTRWLVGILVNHARMEWRRASRSLDVDRLSDAPSTHPLLEVESKELAETVSQALENLSRHYREVLTLHLVHGLQSAQIAHALGRPPETVKSQLRRGLKRLRESLPMGLAPTVLAAALTGSLTAARRAVLCRAAEVAGVTKSRA